MSHYRMIARGLRRTPWSRLLEDLAGIGLVLATPALVGGLCQAVGMADHIPGYLLSLHYLSPAVAVVFILVMLNRLRLRGQGPLGGGLEG